MSHINVSVRFCQYRCSHIHIFYSYQFTLTLCIALSVWCNNMASYYLIESSWTETEADSNLQFCFSLNLKSSFDLVMLNWIRTLFLFSFPYDKTSSKIHSFLWHVLGFKTHVSLDFNFSCFIRECCFNFLYMKFILGSYEWSYESFYAEEHFHCSLRCDSTGPPWWGFRLCHRKSWGARKLGTI